jgi:hypothetical protein
MIIYKNRITYICKRTERTKIKRAIGENKAKRGKKGNVKRMG